MLEVYFSRKFSAFIAAASLAVTGLCVLGLTRIGPDAPVWVTLFMVLMTPLGVLGTAIGVRQLVQPPLMFSANRRGVTIHYEANRRKYGGAGVFLPWDIVGKLELTKVPVNDHHVAWVIRCVLTAAAPFPVQAHCVVWSSAWDEQTVVLDAYTGTVSMHKLLNRLRSLHRASSNAASSTT